MIRFPLSASPALPADCLSNSATAEEILVQCYNMIFRKLYILVIWNIIGLIDFDIANCIDFCMIEKIQFIFVF